MTDGPITRWDREAPTIFADAVLGSARAGGVHRITFGALIFNHEPDASIPAWNPAVTLALPFGALRPLIDYLTSLETDASAVTEEDAADD